MFRVTGSIEHGSDCAHGSAPEVDPFNVELLQEELDYVAQIPGLVQTHGDVLALAYSRTTAVEQAHDVPVLQQVLAVLQPLQPGPAICVQKDRNLDCSLAGPVRHGLAGVHLIVLDLVDMCGCVGSRLGMGLEQGQLHFPALAQESALLAVDLKVLAVGLAFDYELAGAELVESVELAVGPDDVQRQLVDKLL